MQNGHRYYGKKDKTSEIIARRLLNNKIDLDDVIDILDNIILTEKEAECIALIWNLLDKDKCIDWPEGEITACQFQEKCPELYEDNEVNRIVAEYLSKRYNLQRQQFLENRASAHIEKEKRLEKDRNT